MPRSPCPTLQPRFVMPGPATNSSFAEETFTGRKRPERTDSSRAGRSRRPEATSCGGTGGRSLRSTSRTRCFGIRTGATTRSPPASARHSTGENSASFATSTCHETWGFSPDPSIGPSTTGWKSWDGSGGRSSRPCSKRSTLTSRSVMPAGAPCGSSVRMWKPAGEWSASTTWRGAGICCGRNGTTPTIGCMSSASSRSKPSGGMCGFPRRSP